MRSAREYTAVALKRLPILLTAWLVCLLATSVHAGTLVRISTTMGDYTIELLDDVAPITVQNFLNYVERGDYNQTYIHRSVDNFVVQGGAYRFQPFFGPIDIPTDPPIQNEYNVSNTRGTVAMAKFGGDPDSATNQWFVSVTDNSGTLDDQNGGFTVFGNVLGDGMVVVDTINNLPIAPRPFQDSFKAPSAPYASTVWEGNPQHFVYITATVVDRFSSAVSVFEAARLLLITTVDIDDGAAIFSLNMTLIDDPFNVILELNPLSIVSVVTAPDVAATYSSSDSTLRIPELEINNGNGTTTVCTNVVFELSDPQLLRFRLVDFDHC